jgi:nucleotide-binding universal stress UspA family protein
MTMSKPFEAILVPIDFSLESLRALDVALDMRAPSGEVTALHVIDTDLATRIDRMAVAPYGEAVAKMRARAQEETAWLTKEKAQLADVMIVEGVPFMEILKIATDIEVDLIVIGTRGAAAPLNELLFGGTADKVLRGARCPVLCVP